MEEKRKGKEGEGWGRRDGMGGTGGKEKGGKGAYLREGERRGERKEKDMEIRRKGVVGESSPWCAPANQ